MFVTNVVLTIYEEEWIDGKSRKSELFLSIVRLLSVNSKCNYENLIELSEDRSWEQPRSIRD